jgi:hypothetical protein
MLFPDQVVLLNNYGYTSEERKKVDNIESIVQFNFLGLLAACDVLKDIAMPEGETYESLFEITKKILRNQLKPSEIDELKDPRFKNANDIILRACKVFHNQIKNKESTGHVHEVTIDNLFKGKISKYTGNMEIRGLDSMGIRFPLIIGSNDDEQKEILKKFKEVTLLCNPNVMTPTEVEESLFSSGRVCYGGFTKKRTRRPQRKCTKRNRSNRHRRRPHRRTSRK